MKRGLPVKLGDDRRGWLTVGSATWSLGRKTAVLGVEAPDEDMTGIGVVVSIQLDPEQAHELAEWLEQAVRGST